jgi:hypothetical protein
MFGEREALHSCSPFGVSHGIRRFGEFEPEGRHSGLLRSHPRGEQRKRIPPFGLTFRSMADPHGSRKVGYGNVALRAGILVQQSLELVTLPQSSPACLAVPLILTFLGLKAGEMSDSTARLKADALPEQRRCVSRRRPHRKKQAQQLCFVIIAESHPAARGAIV